MEQAGPSKIAPPGPSSTGLGPAEQQASLLVIQAEVKEERLYFIRAHTKIEPKFTFVSQVSEDLQIANSDLPRLYKMKEVMDALKECEGIKSGSEAAKHLKASMKEWEKNLRILSPGARVKDQSKLGSAPGSQTSPLHPGQFGLRPFEQGSS
jgi:hypothetical protein